MKPHQVNVFFGGKSNLETKVRYTSSSAVAVQYSATVHWTQKTRENKSGDDKRKQLRFLPAVAAFGAHSVVSKAIVQ